LGSSVATGCASSVSAGATAVGDGLPQAVSTMLNSTAMVKNVNKDFAFIFSS
jgi:hypothetical protein